MSAWLRYREVSRSVLSGWGCLRLAPSDHVVTWLVTGPAEAPVRNEVTARQEPFPQFPRRFKTVRSPKIVQVPDHLRWIRQRDLHAPHICHQGRRGKHRLVAWHADDDVRIVPALRLDQAEAGRLDQLLRIQDHLARAAPGQDEIGPSVRGHRHLVSEHTSSADCRLYR